MTLLLLKKFVRTNINEFGAEDKTLLRSVIASVKAETFQRALEEFQSHFSKNSHSESIQKEINAVIDVLKERCPLKNACPSTNALFSTHVRYNTVNPKRKLSVHKSHRPSKRMDRTCGECGQKGHAKGSNSCPSNQSATTHHHNWTPDVAKPTTSVVAKPMSVPVVAKPMTPVVAKPTTSVVAKPTTPVVAKPVEVSKSKQVEPLPEPDIPPPPVPTVELPGVESSDDEEYVEEEDIDRKNTPHLNVRDVIKVTLSVEGITMAQMERAPRGSSKKFKKDLNYI